jgi:prepilin-type N-terminal cleavage/methylation domain-containing protein
MANLKISGNKKGVTVLELMIVILIMGILATTVYQYYAANMSTARKTRAKMDMEAIKKEVKKYMITSGGVYPSKLEQLKGNYPVPRTPWGGEYELDTVKEEVICRYSENDAWHTLRLRYKPKD